MKILIVIGSLRGGGAERQVRYLVKSLSEGGDVLRVCIMERGPQPAQLGSTPITALRLKSGSWLGAISQLRRLSSDYDVVYSFMDIANAFVSMALVRSKTPHVWGLRNSGIAAGFLPRASFHLSKLLSSRANIAVGNSDAVVQFYQQSGFRPAKWAVISNGVDTSIYKPRQSTTAEEDANRTDPKDPVVGMIARADSFKRHDIFFAMVAHLKARYPNVTWLIAGLGTDGKTGTIAELMNQFHVTENVKALGEVEDVAGLVASLDIAVCCSDFEGSSNSILEAIACGVPVVSFNVGNAATMLSDCGIIVEPPSLEGLTSAVADLLDNPERRHHLGHAGRQAAMREHSIERLSLQTRELLAASISATASQLH